MITTHTQIPSQLLVVSVNKYKETRMVIKWVPI